MSMKIKKTLLEYLVRECIHEVMAQVGEAGDETKGAPAPPADGTGSGENLGIPKDSTEKAPPAPQNLKGAVLVNPKNKALLKTIPLKPNSDDATIDRTLHQISSAMAGSRVKIAVSTMRSVRETLRNPSSVVYLYLGKFDPESEEIFLMADKSLQVAKDASISPSEFGTPVTPLSPTVNFDPFTGGTPEELAQINRSKIQGYARKIPSQEQPEDMDEPHVDENLKRMIKKLVNEILSK